MKKHRVLVLAISLGAIGVPPAVSAAGDDETSGAETTRSGYEQAVELRSVNEP